MLDRVQTRSASEIMNIRLFNISVSHTSCQDMFRSLFSRFQIVTRGNDLTCKELKLTNYFRWESPAIATALTGLMTVTASLHSAQQVGYTPLFSSVSIDHITLNNGHILNIDKVSLRDNSLYLDWPLCLPSAVRGTVWALCARGQEKLLGVLEWLMSLYHLIILISQESY